MDLQTARATVSALDNRNKDLGKSYYFVTKQGDSTIFRINHFSLSPSLEELHQVTKTQNEEMENENVRLNGECCILFFYFDLN